MSTWTRVLNISYTCTKIVLKKSNGHVHDTGEEIHNMHTCITGHYMCTAISREADAHKQSKGKQNERRGQVSE